MKFLLAKVLLLWTSEMGLENLEEGLLMQSLLLFFCHNQGSACSPLLMKSLRFRHGS